MAENQAFVYVLNSKYSAKFAISAILINPQQDTKSDNFSHYALNLHEGVKRVAVFSFSRSQSLGQMKTSKYQHYGGHSVEQIWFQI